MKKKVTLYFDEGLVQKAKIRAVLEKTNLSVLVERILNDYLAGSETKGKSKSKRQA
jgi:hypothetical protein